MLNICFYLIRVQSKVSIEQLPSVVVWFALVDLVGGIADLDVHCSVGHPLVLEAFGPAAKTEAVQSDSFCLTRQHMRPKGASRNKTTSQREGGGVIHDCRLHLG